MTLLIKYICQSSSVLMDKANKRGHHEKQSQPRPKKTENKIKFSFNKTDIQCFISAKTQPKSKQIPMISDKQEEPQQLSMPGKDQSPSHSKRPASKVDAAHKIFNNQLLVMHYDQDEMYIDSCRGSSPNNGIHESEDDQNEIVNSCVKVITEQTDNSSNNPLSARYNAMAPLQMYPSYDYRYYMDARNRRAVSMEESTMYQIDIENIEKDSRTTIMLRNIPNKYTRDMLLDEIDGLNFKKKYDFFYLPIDYRNQCNVGYAFINFIHKKFIVEFYQQFHEKRWQKFNSEKICQVCYARIQGTAQLMNHFKNSNVIQQKDKKLRPLIEVDLSSIAQIVERQKNETSRETSA